MLESVINGAAGAGNDIEHNQQQSFYYRWERAERKAAQ
jgi:hypothetical protein